jgi:hypothetical protein
MKIMIAHSMWLLKDANVNAIRPDKLLTTNVSFFVFDML